MINHWTYTLFFLLPLIKLTFRYDEKKNTGNCSHVLRNFRMLWCLHDTFCCCFSLSFFWQHVFHASQAMNNNNKLIICYNSHHINDDYNCECASIRFFSSCSLYWTLFVYNTYRLEATKKVQRKKILNNFLFCWWFSFRQFVGCLHNFFVIFFNFLINIMLFIITLVRL